MEYNQNMNLQSKSGYCMPFEEKKGRVEILRHYGEDADGNFNHGVDFRTRNFLVAAVADGKVIGAMNNADGASLIMQYGDYVVTYSKLKTRFAQIDQTLKAGLIVGMAGESLHIEVKYNGEVIDGVAFERSEKEINPMEFLTMIYGNIKMMMQTGKVAVPDFETVDMDVPTNYDDDKEEIEDLMLRFYPSYLADLKNGDYLLPSRTEASLRNIFSWAAVKQFFFRRIPHLGNPAGLDDSSIPLAVKAQNLLIEDFLNYLAIRQQIFLSSLSDDLKKKTMSKPY